MNRNLRIPPSTSGSVPLACENRPVVLFGKEKGMFVAVRAKGGVLKTLIMIPEFKL